MPLELRNMADYSLWSPVPSGVKWLLRMIWDPFLLLSSPMSQEAESDTRSGSTYFVLIIQSVQPSKLGQVTCINIIRPNMS